MIKKYFSRIIALAVIGSLFTTGVAFAHTSMGAAELQGIRQSMSMNVDNREPVVEINEKRYENAGVKSFFGEYYFSMDLLKTVLNINLVYSLKDDEIHIDWKGIMADVSCNKLEELESSEVTEKNPGGFPVIFGDMVYLPESFLRDVLKIGLTYDEAENLFALTYTDEKKTAGEQKVAYLTFDDGIDPEVTNQVLDVLDEKGVKGTFFVIGKTISWNKGTIDRIVDNGHILGNHSYSHKASYLYASLGNLDDELKKTDEAFEKVLGWAPKYFRPPYGISYIRGKEIKDYLEGRYLVELWNVDSRDSLEKDITADKVFRNIKNGTVNKKRAVILMHCTKNNKTTAEALPLVIDWLKENGYELRTLAQD